jgi:quinol monooxygenase YgiN
MNARITTLRARDGQLDRVLRLITEVAMPAAERQEGFAALIVMSNRGANKILTTSLWETEADMLASEDGEYLQEQISRFVVLLAGPPEIEHFRVDAMS